ncbi:toll/interleukin-1 receptor domain-containing protein [Saccharothrix sp. Mg75]|uniref:toll/interleukin-1 receptor domain-containing protein n=1 Tax=Saccharothrix sp. Mg75 TaxID=3445357 RepID=UPI003EECF3ED
MDRNVDPMLDAFLSYSHVDHRVALALRDGLHNLARPWYRRRALWVFRDEESLPAGANLPELIVSALRRSRYFVLVASPNAAGSEWVAREVRYWREHREPETFLIVRAGGAIAWGDDDFDWDATDALPRDLAGWFPAEPLWADLAWAGSDDELSLRHSRFRSVVTSVAAPLHGLPKDELDSEDVRRHRATTRVRNTAVSLLAALMSLVLVLAGVALWQRGEVEQQRDRSLSRELAGRAERLGDADPALSRLLALTAWRVRATPEARAGMYQAAGRPGVFVLDTGGNAVAFSPDGGLLATADESVRLWDVATRTEKRRLGEDGEPVRSLLFSPDGGMLITADESDSVTFWDIATGKRKGETINCGQGPRSIPIPFAPPIALSPDGSILATGCDSGTIRLWDVASRRPLGQLAGHEHHPIAMLGPSVAFRPDGRTLMSASIDGTARFWDVAEQRQLSAFSALPTQSAAFLSPSATVAPDGEIAATVALDGSVTVWDAANPDRHGTLVGGRSQPNDSISTVAAAFAADSSLLATGGHDGTIRFWDVDERRQHGPALAGHSRSVVSLAFSPDRRLMASGGGDGTVRLWDVTAHVRSAAPRTADIGQVASVAFTPDSRSLVAASLGEWGADDPNGNAQCLGICEAGNVRRINGKPVVTWWDVGTRAVVDSEQPQIVGYPRSVVVTADGTALVHGTDHKDDQDKGHLRIWTLRDRDVTGDATIGPAASATLDPTGTTLAVFDDDDLRLWDVARRQQIASLDGAKALSVVFSQDGNRLAAQRDGGKIEVWDVGTRRRIGELALPDTGAVPLAFSPNGRLVATTGGGGVIRLSDVDTGEVVGDPLLGHTGAVSAVAFSLDSRLLVSGSADATVRLWDLDSRRQVSQPPMGHRLPVRTVAFAPDGRTVASGGVDGAVRLWDVGYTTDVEASLCAAAGRSMTEEEWTRYVPDLPFRQIC